MSPDFPENNGTTTFGLHLMLDAYESDPVRLDDMKLVYKFLNDAPGIIGMKKLTTPVVADADLSASGKDPGGISGFVMIAESHISIHTFAKRGFFTLDVYSCRNFEEKIDTLMNYIKETFSFGEHELQVVKRGLHYPVKDRA